MTRRPVLAALAILLATLPALAADQITTASLLGEMYDLERLTRFPGPPILPPARAWWLAPPTAPTSSAPRIERRCRPCGNNTAELKLPLTFRFRRPLSAAGLSR